jgi:alkanesulfonate monooxygenase SsuD/methylene tetrahydromethanopterin reductase-like flavin-dependent oxidoreductase (luciferase family)
MKFWAVTAFMKSDELIELARMLDEAGYHGVTVSDHIFYPRELKSPYPYSPYPDGRPIWEPETSWPDTWVLIGAMIGATRNLHFTNNIYIAGNRPILVVAKQVGTAAVLSNNRVELGVAAGWMREEFELNGQDWDNRGKRLNEMIQALRELWKPGWVQWHGHYGPTPTAPIPIMSGGHTEAALRRAARYCDGWIGNAYPWDEAAQHVTQLRGYLKEYGRESDPFEILVGFYEPPSLDLYRRAADELGVTGTYCLPWSGLENVSEGRRDNMLETASRYRDSIFRFADEIVSKLK